jgi:hypothetical protein
MPPKVFIPAMRQAVKGTFDVIERLIRVWICEDIILSIFSVTTLLQNLAHFRAKAKRESDARRNAPARFSKFSASSIASPITA